MKKVFYIILVLLLLSIAGWYFFFKENPFESENKIILNILGENSATLQAMQSLEEDYEKLHPNIDLKFNPNTFEDAFNKSNQDFINGTGLYDIIMQYNFSLASFVQNDYVHKTEELLEGIPMSKRDFERNLFKNNWQEVGYFYKDYKKPDQGESMVAYPFSAHSMLLMYNEEMFNNEENRELFRDRYNQELVVPTNWSDFYKIAEFFTNNENNIKGVCLGGANDGYLYYTVSNFIYGHNGSILNKEVGWKGDLNTEVSINSEENLAALSLLKSLKPFNKGDFTSVSQYEPFQYMLEGNTAMTFVWSDLIYPNTFKEDEFDSRFGYAPIPGNKSIYIGGAYFISKKSKYPKEALEYILFLHQPENQIKMAQNGLCPSSLITYNNPIVENLPYSKALRESLVRGGVLLEAGPDANMINEVVTTYVQKYWNNEITVEEALDLMEDEIIDKRKKIFSASN
jgi:ABC-type glycerol-3-phosphate transport system substrate-binding protein